MEDETSTGLEVWQNSFSGLFPIGTGVVAEGFTGLGGGGREDAKERDHSIGKEFSGPSFIPSDIGCVDGGEMISPARE
ncbi:hypothetical protein TNCV_2506321, partial [Trichonephila clavipes]